MKSLDPYRQLERKLSAGETIVLDGGIGSELERRGFERTRNVGWLWGTRALYEAPELTKEVHRRYVAAGVDVLKTNTWQIGSMPAAESEGLVDGALGDWRAKAVLAVRLAREAAAEAKRAETCTVAFSLSVRSLERAFLADVLEALSEEPPDLFLVETLTSIPTDLRFPSFEQLLASGLPLWLAYRRCTQGTCDVHGHVLESDAERFHQALAVFAELGVSALLINCLPIDSARGMIANLRQATELPLGIYPNLGQYLDPGWEFDPNVSPRDYAAHARAWRDEGAQIIGGCCGVTPDHIAAVAAAVRNRG
jgi:S-methylmethionine-dependent homocysteine/selenocysteine methylase